MTSAIGTHNLIPNLKPAPTKRKLTIRQIYREIFETLWNRSFVALFAAALFGAIGTGTAAGLSLYLNSFFWGFSTEQYAAISLSVVISAIIGLVISPIVSRKLGKKRAAIITGLLAFTILPVTIILRLLELMPENGDPILFPIILGVTIIDVGNHHLPNYHHVNDCRSSRAE